MPIRNSVQEQISQDEEHIISKEENVAEDLMAAAVKEAMTSTRKCLSGEVFLSREEERKAKEKQILLSGKGTTYYNASSSYCTVMCCHSQSQYFFHNVSVYKIL